MTDKVPAVRIMVYVPRRHCWAVHKTVTSKPALDQELQAIAGRKVRLIPTKTVPPPAVKPPYLGPAAQHRVQRAEEDMVLRLSTTYYKSPG